MIRRITCIFGVLSAIGIAATASRGAPAPANAPTPTAADLEFFEKSVRPLLVERCYKCHSQEAKKVKGNLLLDSADGWLTGGDTGPALVPGNPEKSLIIEAVRYGNADVAMPPKTKLPQGEIDTLVEWVKRGAPAPRAAHATAGKRVIDLEAGRRFWSYQPVRRPEIPKVKDTGWPRNDIDRFILAKLESQNLRPVPDAEPVALVRRLYFDLAGLPPTPEQIDAYLKDASPDRYERLVDQLLASPHFGERWGRHWLDVARYAESLTLRGFVLKDTWRYRDYVIESFNLDRPFDQFMQEQIAGDLMRADSLEEHRRQVVATAFLAMGNNNLEEQDKKQLEMDVVDEQIDTLGKAFLAQTISCARCHDHKFDPIPTRDYYALAGILHSTQTLEHSNVSKWLEIPLPVEPVLEAQLQKKEAAVTALEAKIKATKASLAKVHRGKTGDIIALKDLPGIVVDDAQTKRVGMWRESKAVPTYVGEGYLTDDGDHTELKTITFVPEIAESGKYEVRFAYTPAANRATHVSVTVFSADGDSTVLVNEQEEPPVDGHFISLGQYTFEKNGQGFVLVSDEGADGHVTADAVQLVPADAAPAATADTTAAPKGKGGSSPAMKQMEAELKQLLDRGPKREAVASIREAKEIGDTRINVRGSIHTLGEPAPRGFLQVISIKTSRPIPAKQSGRRELAQWLADPENPLPARVMANRTWHWLFGVGIVRTSDNFGTTGELPSHPELLDYLAGRFVEEHWSVKTLVRQLVLSHTYRLSTASDAKSLAADPENRLLWRMNHRRLDAECIRDAMLSASGQLATATGGVTYKPGMTSDFAFKNDNASLRSVYLPVFRNALPELFEAFDFADPSVSSGRRNTSTVAPQALFMMNHPFVLEQSRQAAKRLLADATCTDDSARIERVYRLTLGRLPTADEKRLAMGFIRETASGETEWSELFHALFASMDFRYVD